MVKPRGQSSVGALYLKRKMGNCLKRSSADDISLIRSFETTTITSGGSGGNNGGGGITGRSSSIVEQIGPISHNYVSI